MQIEKYIFTFFVTEIFKKIDCHNMPIEKYICEPSHLNPFVEFSLYEKYYCSFYS